jgi:hypothetical protein
MIKDKLKKSATERNVLRNVLKLSNGKVTPEKKSFHSTDSNIRKEVNLRKILRSPKSRGR